MAGVRKPRPPGRASAKALAAITQAQFMIGIYGEIVAMDQVIIERVRQLLMSRTAHNEATTLANLQLVLEQLEKVGERLSYWSDRVHELVEGSLGQGNGEGQT
jgi:glutamate 5-kinase